ncbi:hypothetical protein [Halioxenophilus aromaticivorans]|uniref:Uncharacterized protein n=1 Tax=Halioxenophilus aromaticivorans TaxID=1306992 RepID=A0AAV3TY94_9ALTE
MSTSQVTIEYVIVSYTNGKVVTIIGFDTPQATLGHFQTACIDNRSDWATLMNSSDGGSLLASFRNNQYIYY